MTGPGSLAPDPRHARLVAATELRRRWRTVRDDRLKLATLAVGGLFGLVFVAALSVGAYYGGRTLAAGTVDDPVGIGRSVAATVWVLALAVVGFRTFVRTSRIDGLDGLLTTVPHRDVAGGVLLAETAWLAAIAAPPLLIATAAFVAGSGSAAAGVFVPVAATLAGVAGTAAGFALGLAGRTLVARSAFAARHRTLLGAAVLVAYLGLLATNSVATAMQPVVAAFTGSPVGWLGDAALLGTAAAANPVLAAAGVAATLGVVAALIGASTWLAGELWYADPVTSNQSTPTRSSIGVRTASLAGVVPRPVTRVAAKSWVRARRAPIKLLYVTYPAFLFVQPAVDAIQAGRVPAAFPPAVAFYAAWSTGAAFTLNPLGDEGAALPVTVTSGVRGREFVAGRMLAGLSVGAPITVAATLAVGVASSLSVAGAVGVTVLGGVLCVGATAVAAAAGTAFPRFEAVNVTRSRTAVVPSLYAFAAYSVALAALWAPGAAVGLFGDAAADAVGVSPTPLRAGVLLATAALVAAAGLACFRYAVRGFDRFALD